MAARRRLGLNTEFPARSESLLTLALCISDISFSPARASSVITHPGNSNRLAQGFLAALHPQHTSCHRLWPWPTSSRLLQRQDLNGAGAFLADPLRSFGAGFDSCVPCRAPPTSKQAAAEHPVAENLPQVALLLACEPALHNCAAKVIAHGQSFAHHRQSAPALAALILLGPSSADATPLAQGRSPAAVALRRAPAFHDSNS